jgi:hypothetical protein
MWKKILEIVGWSNRQAIVFLAFLYLFIVLPFFLEAAALNNALLWLIGVMLLLYMVETHGLRADIRRQNQGALEPLVIATVEERPQGDGDLRPRSCIILKNLGRGPALSVLVYDFEVDKAINGQLIASFEVIDYIDPGHEKIAPRKWRDNRRGVGSSEAQELISNLDLRESSRIYILTIAYEDIDEKMYESVVQLGKSGVRLLRHGRTAHRRR